MKLISERKCPDGEKYYFRNGVAEVPGMSIAGKPVKITLLEFMALCKQVPPSDSKFCTTV